jgi:DNA-binding NarL/FixJ family response regulator
MATPRAKSPADGKHPASIVLIEDNRLVREGLARLLRDQRDFEILACAADPEEALRKTREAKPQVVLLDVALQGREGREVLAAIHRQAPEAKVVVMGLSPLSAQVTELVRAGAAGFLMKDASFDAFLGTVRAVVDGTAVLPSELTGTLFTEIADQVPQRDLTSPLDALRLTPREREVVDMIGAGLSNQEIANRLGIAIHTVKSHVHNVLEKLSLRSRLEVAAFTRRPWLTQR